MRREIVLVNRIKCLKCGDIVESTHGHDYRSCKCGNCAADGGQNYRRRSWASGPIEEAYEDISEYYVHYVTDKWDSAPIKEKLEFSPHLPDGHKRHAISRWLSEKPGIVTFTKIDGDLRVMPCTLQESVLPKIEKKTERTKKPNLSIMSVYATDKNEWRSFKLANVISIEEV